jgi:lipopolysaccharide biosynthesis protein
MKRIAFYVFYDEQGIVDDYIVYQIKKLREHVKHIVFTVNGLLTADSREKITPFVDTLFFRSNIGLDAGAHKETLAFLGKLFLSEFDELLLINATFYGPIYPLHELFDWSKQQDVSFWGVSDHDKAHRHTETYYGEMPRHIQSYFIGIRKTMFDTNEFEAYWDSMSLPSSHNEAIEKYEITFTAYFSDKGHRFAVYSNLSDYNTASPTMLETINTLKNRFPFVKRRIFFHDPLWGDLNAISARDLIPFIEKYSDYPVNLIYKNLSRSVKPKDLAVNIDALKIFDNEEGESLKQTAKIAALAHVFYPEMIEELLCYTENIPQTYDFFITTTSENSKLAIQTFISNWHKKGIRNLANYEIRIMPENKGRDIAPLLIGLKSIVLEGDYDFFCRIHAKKSPQNGKLQANFFKEYLLDNVLASKTYVAKLLNYFNDNKHVGMLVPPMIHGAGFNTLGHSWGGQKENLPIAQFWANKLGIQVPFDDFSPFATYGSIYWFRPMALKKVFEYPFSWNDFPKEPIAIDGTIAHGLERLLVYAAHDAGYFAYNVMASKMAEKMYLKLEYKSSKLMSHFSAGDTFHQIHELTKLKESHPSCSISLLSQNSVMGVKQSTRFLIMAVGRSLNVRCPRVALFLKPAYRLLKRVIK